jgi:hypothetical protein
MRLPGDVVFSYGAILMCCDILMKLRQPRVDIQEPRARAAAVAAE